MSRSSKSKFHQKGRANGSFLQLHNYMMDSEAWLSLHPFARCIYMELKCKYKGYNNGKIILSHRSAAARLGVNRNTVGKYFKELEEKGVIRVGTPHALGVEGIGKSTLWILEEEQHNGAAATKTFMKWRKPKPAQKNRRTRPNPTDAPVPKNEPNGASVVNIGTHLSDLRKEAS